ILAVKAATEEALEHRHLEINSDSRYAINGLTKYRHKWEDNGFIGTSNAKLFQVTIARLRERHAKTTLRWVKGHDGIAGNEEADRLAGQGARKDTEDEVDLEIDVRLKLTGAKLSTMTQALAYKAIRSRKLKRNTKAFLKQIERRETIRNMEITRYAAEELSGGLPTNRKIWKATRHQDLTRQTRYFHWMVMHNAYKVGEYWSRMKDPEIQERGTCQSCFVLEDMEHILTRCKCAGQQEVWDLARQTWLKKRGTKWRKPKFGTILACTLADLQSRRGKRRPGATRLFRILISEAAHLIWKLRNERTIPDAQGRTQPEASIKEIKSRFFQALDRRLAYDLALTNKARYGRRALSKKSVLGTWNGVLENDANLPADWTGENEVLVG
ncbi:hypothetical protein C8J56DRAFT_719621, partial [Mycena floridula]